MVEDYNISDIIHPIKAHIDESTSLSENPICLGSHFFIITFLQKKCVS